MSRLADLGGRAGASLLSTLQAAVGGPLAPPCAVVGFDATGDFARRKRFSALYNLMQSGQLPGAFALVGVGTPTRTEAGGPPAPMPSWPARGGPSGIRERTRAAPGRHPGLARLERLSIPGVRL